jgi:hypothetical protein
MEFLILLVMLPLATLIAACYALRPRGPVLAPKRLAVVRAVVLVGGYAVICVELLSAVGLLNRAAVIVSWAIALSVAVIAAYARWRRRQVATESASASPSRLGLLEWLIIAGLAAFAVATLTVALVAEPNNWDSQAYHLPKIEHWVANGSVGPFAAFYPPQVAFAPGAEYLLLHLRFLTGGDMFYNLLQWGSVVVATATASRISAQLGGKRTAQLITAFAVVTTPMVVLQATSTQTDMVTAAWCAAVVTLSLDAAWTRTRTWSVLLIGIALGLAWVTKATGVVIAGPFIALWFVARAVQVRSVGAAGRLVATAAGVAAIALAITGPFLVRTADTYGHPLGPIDARDHSMQRHDPAAVIVNAAKFAQSAAMVPSERVNDVTARAVIKFAHALDVGINDPLTTMMPTFPRPFGYGHDEDRATLPLQVAAIGIGLTYALLSWRRNRRLAAYALTVVLMAVGIVAIVKWQFWLTRLLMPAVTLALPLFGLAIGTMLDSARWKMQRIASTVLVVLLLPLAAAEAALTGLTGTPRPLIGPTSVLRADPWETRFSRMPVYQEDYIRAAARIRATGARRVGLVVGGGTGFEYPMYLLLPGRTIVPLESSVPGRPAAAPTDVDAIVCVSQTPRCSSFVPQGWTLEGWSYAQVILPPSAARPTATATVAAP